MLNRIFRISKSKDYQHTYKKGLKVPGKYIIAYICANGMNKNRFGVVASKKVGNAVKRNKAKRRLRAIAQESPGKLSQGYDIVMIARQSMVGADYNRIEKDFYSVMKKARLC